MQLIKIVLALILFVLLAPIACVILGAIIFIIQKGSI
jgi:hypothetical protein